MDLNKNLLGQVTHQQSELIILIFFDNFTCSVWNNSKWLNLQMWTILNNSKNVIFGITDL